MSGALRIAVIGGGVSGLLCTLALRLVANSVKERPIEVMLFQDDASFYKKDEHQRSWILWPWAYKILEGYMGKSIIDLIKDDIYSAKLVDLESNKIISSIGDNAPTGINNFAAFDDMGKHRKLYSIRVLDLLRILLISLKVESVAKKSTSHEFHVNKVKALYEKAYDPSTWFEDESYAQDIPGFYIGHKLTSYVISSPSAKITLKFSNLSTVEADMLIGADGKDSVIRSMLGGERNDNIETNIIHLYGLVAKTDETVTDSETPLNTSDKVPIVEPNKDDVLSNYGTSYNLVSRTNGFIFNTVCNESGEISWSLTTTKDNIKRCCKKCSDYYNEMVSENILPEGKYIEGVADFLQSLYLKLEDNTTDSDFRGLLDAACKDTKLDRGSIAQEEIEKRALNLIAICMTSDPQPLSKLAKSIIKKTCLELFFFEAFSDDWDNQLESFTSPDFYPGKVVLIGDAARTITIGSLGLGGAMVAFVGVYMFVKLFYGLFPKSDCNENSEDAYSNIDSYDIKLSELGFNYDKKMGELSTKISSIIHDEISEYLTSELTTSMKILRKIKNLTYETFKHKGFQELMDMVEVD